MNEIKTLQSKDAKKIAEFVCDKTITVLTEATDKLSSDDSGLTTTWDEVCAQVQFEYSFHWEIYEQRIERIVNCFVNQLNKEEQFALWIQTDEGQEWFYEKNDTPENCNPVSIQAIVHYILAEFVMKKAGSWSNEKIQDYLSHQ